MSVQTGGHGETVARETCERCGETLPGPPDLATIAAGVDATLAAEFGRPVARADWAAKQPDGLSDNLLAWLPGAREGRAIWKRGQELWKERVTAARQVVCPTCGLTPSEPATAEGSRSGAAPTASTADSGVSPAGNEPGTQGETAAPHPRAPRLVMVEGPSTGQSFELNRPVTNVGRHAACQIRVEATEVAAQHAQILSQGGRWIIRDVPGSGGSYVNGEPVGETRDLQAGDEIRVGPARFRFGT